MTTHTGIANSPRSAFIITALSTAFVLTEAIVWVITQSFFAVRFSALDLLFHFGPCLLMMACTILLRFHPKHTKIIAVGIGLSAIFSLLSGGGFLVGFTLGVVGAILALFYNTKIARPIQNRLMGLTRGKRLAILITVIVGASLVVMPTELSFQIAMNQARTTPAFETQLIETPSGLIEYADIGNGYPVLVSHGTGLGYMQIESVQQMLGDEDFRFICPSRFGYIKTPLPSDASFDAQATAFAELLDALNISKVVIMGVSIGGPAALAFATLYPERCSALIMAAAISHNTPPFDAMGTFTHQVIFRSDFGIWILSTALRPELVSFLGVSKQVQANLTSEDNAYLSDLLLAIQPISLRQCGMVNDPTHSALEVEEFPLGTITMPTLVFHAKDDGLVPFDHGQYTAEHINGSRFVELESGGHLLVGQLDVIYSETQSFLRENKVIT